MKFRNLWTLVALLAISSQAVAQEQNEIEHFEFAEETAQDASSFEFFDEQSATSPQKADALTTLAPNNLIGEIPSQSFDTGEWLWVMSNDSLLSRGATAVETSPYHPKTIYMGGFESVIVSNDGGKTFHESLSFSGSSNNDPIQTFETGDSTLDIQRADALREYLRENLESQYGSSVVESWLDDITDEDLLQADDVTDLEPLQDLDLEMDTDLRAIQLEDLQASSIRQTNLSNFDSFIVRFRMANNAGASHDDAVTHAAQSPSVWQIHANKNAAYVVTSTAVFKSTDLGKTWTQILQPAEEEYFLSIATSPDDTQLAVGMSNGLIISSDAGMSWQRDATLNSAVYDIEFAADSGKLWALTLSGAYTSDVSKTIWTSLPTPLSTSETSSEIPLRIAPKHNGGVYLLTNENLYTSDDLLHWNTLGTQYLNDAYLRDITFDDDSNSSFILLTDSQVFEYANGTWIDQSKGLKTSSSAHVARLYDDPHRFAILISDDAALFAHNAQNLEGSDSYRELQKKWEREPSDIDVIQAALAAHYLDGSLYQNWKARSRLAWFLPQVDAYYYYQERRYDKKTESETESSFITTTKYDYIREKKHEWEVRALWNLRIEEAFKRDFDAEKLKDLRQMQDDLIVEVQKQLRNRRSLQIQQIIQHSNDNSPSILEEINTTLMIDETETTLHYLTGGYYKNAIRSR